MKLKNIILTFLLLTICAVSSGQDSLYAKTIDSSFMSSYQKKMIYKKKENVDGIKLDFTFYKKSNTIWTIISFDKSPRELILFFYVQNKIVMISPVGQKPYYILNDRFIYGKELKHSSEQILSLFQKRIDTWFRLTADNK